MSSHWFWYCCCTDHINTEKNHSRPPLRPVTHSWMLVKKYAQVRDLMQKRWNFIFTYILSSSSFFDNHYWQTRLKQLNQHSECIGCVTACFFFTYPVHANTINLRKTTVHEICNIIQPKAINASCEVRGKSLFAGLDNGANDLRKSEEGDENEPE